MASRDNQARWGRPAARGDLALAALTFNHRGYTLYGPTRVDARPRGNVQLHFQYQQSYMDRSHVSRFTALYSELVKRARRKVVLYMPYLNPPAALERAIIDTARRGVEVVLLTNSKEANDEPLAHAVAQPYLARFVHNGVHVHEYLPAPFTRRPS
jgi:phosphatidylserine/phosphatidylglycerophosphate/cardiolipin synthase-like enzyme